MTNLIGDLQSFWSFLAALFCVGFCVGVTLAILILLARELCAAKAIETRRRPSAKVLVVESSRDQRRKGELSFVKR